MDKDVSLVRTMNYSGLIQSVDEQEESSVEDKIVEYMLRINDTCNRPWTRLMDDDENVMFLRAMGTHCGRGINMCQRSRVERCFPFVECRSSSLRLQLSCVMRAWEEVPAKCDILRPPFDRSDTGKETCPLLVSEYFCFLNGFFPCQRI